jgi:hypothetical protein
MAYKQRYKIEPGVQGYWVFQNDEVWTQLGSPFKTKEEAEAAIKRCASREVYYYDENGEAV